MSRDSREKLAKSIPEMTAKDVARFWNKVEKTDTCWNWKMPTKLGYGAFNICGEPFRAHRVSLVIHGTDVARDLVVDHVCRNRACVNPAHLRQVPTAVNILENSMSRSAFNAVKTHCPQGHAYEGDNVRSFHSDRKSRVCLICKRAQATAERRRNRKNRKLRAKAVLEGKSNG